jgi:hypothetical protein
MIEGSSSKEVSGLLSSWCISIEARLESTISSGDGSRGFVFFTLGSSD